MQLFTVTYSYLDILLLYNYFSNWKTDIVHNSVLSLSFNHVSLTECIKQLLYTGTSKKKIDIKKKGQYFLSLISESETHVLYRFITHRVK